jgi:hypothetical protein
MVFKVAATLVARLSRAFVSQPFKTIFAPRIYQIKQTEQIYSKYPTKFYLFPSIYRSLMIPINGENLANLMPSRIVLNEIKRRFFFAG